MAGEIKSALSSSGDDLESFPSNDVGTSDQHSSNDEPLNAVAKSTGNFEKNDDVKYSDDDRESAPSNDEGSNRNDQRNKDDTQNTESAENCNRRGSKVSQNSRGCNGAKRTADDGQASSDPTQPRDPERVEVEMPQTTDTGNGEITAKTEEADVSQADQRNRKRYALGRKLQDLPRNMSFLMRQPIFATTVCGTILWSYFHAGYYAVLPQYLQSQFYQSEQAAHTTAGVCFGLASSLGVVLSAVATHRWCFNIARQMALALAAMTVCTVILLILFAFGCDDAKQLIGDNSAASHFAPICTDSCSCAQSQYEPVCSADHRRFASPCLAGCSIVEISPTLNFSGCACAGEDPSEVSADWCQTCGTLVPYVLFLFLAVTTHAAVPLPVLLIFLRKVPEKLRSLSLGFSAWLVYVISYSPGYTAYYSIADEACLMRRKNCYEHEQCWQRNNRRHRFMIHGITVALQVAAMLCFTGSWYRLRLQTKLSATSGVANRTDMEQPAPLDIAPTQNSDDIQTSISNDKATGRDTAVQGSSNLAFTDDQCPSTETKV
ncbi:hypothetical protein LSAT2_007418 [Lamellibrachia satsuma]|nr:hypothetical protein LSAT2_007418 [Lamellibrachia satsuma]